jgi:hypothetical protein
MGLFCIKDFKDEYEKLIKNNSYRDLKQQIIDNFFEKEFSELCSGTRLNHCKEEPYIKKRIKGSGGYRFYYLLIIKDSNVYLMFVHPKTGKFGSENIDEGYKAEVYKTVLQCIEEDDLFVVDKCPKTNNLLFIPTEEIKESA